MRHSRAQFHSPLLRASDFEAKPMVLLLGQYSVGKTSFIRYLLGRDFPGIRIGASQLFGSAPQLYIHFKYEKQCNSDESVLLCSFLPPVADVQPLGHFTCDPVKMFLFSAILFYFLMFRPGAHNGSLHRGDARAGRPDHPR